MNITAERGSHGEQIRLTLWLDNDEARRIANALRELTGDAKPPAKPETWKPLTAADPSPLPSPELRAQIQATLGRKRA